MEKALDNTTPIVIKALFKALDCYKEHFTLAERAEIFGVMVDAMWGKINEIEKRESDNGQTRTY